MVDKRTSSDTGLVRLRAAEEALREVQAQAAALEELSEQLSLSVHVLEAEIASLGERLRSEAIRQADTPGGAPLGAHAERAGRSTDADGARLVALNMALDGDPREVTGGYLAQHFDIPDRERLLDEVYAAVGE
jgi:hypothetical protein